MKSHSRSDRKRRPIRSALAAGGPGKSLLGAAAAVMLAATTVAALSAGAGAGAASSSASKSAIRGGSRAQKAVNGGTATLGITGVGWNYIFPFLTPAADSEVNWEISTLLYVPLYVVNNTIDKEASLADPPVYSDGNKTVTIHLKSYRWSTGQPVTSRDVTFFLNLLEANKTDWAHYVAGEIPDNLTSFSAPNSTTVVLHMTRAYDPAWFTDQELASFLFAFPQQVWDKESATGAVGNYDETEAGAEAVYKFLASQAMDTSTYATNPLWKVVDGAWKLQTFQTTGPDTFVPNPEYSGPDKPRLSKLVETTYTTDTSEFNALLTGNEIDVGTIPTTDLAQLSRVESAGYGFEPASFYQISFVNLNYENPKTGPLVRQLYIRQALQHLMDETGQVKAYLDNGKGGYAVYGPVPPEPPNPYEASTQKKDPYPFSVSAAKELLKAHGWDVPSSGAATCQLPGTGKKDCGAGITKGEELEFNFVYDSGETFLVDEVRNFKSDAAEAGIVLNLSSGPFTSVVGELLACVGTTKCPASSWQLGTWSTGFSWDYGEPYPTGEVFSSDTNYTSATFTKLADATETSPSPVSAMHAYDSYMTLQLPVIWSISTYELNAVSKNLHGVVFYPSGYIAANEWYYTK